MNREEKLLSVEMEQYGARAGPPGEVVASDGNRPRAPQSDAEASAPPSRRMEQPSVRKRDGPRVKGGKGRKRRSSAQERARQREETSEMWWRFAVKLLLVVVILVAVFRFVLGVQIQRGNRMYPFIMDGDLVITFKLDEYREGDVVAYRRPDTGQIAISRIAARGPCEIRISDGGGLLADGAPREESPFYTTLPLAEYGLNYPYQLSASGYFLLDDNRPIGSDSRAFGEVRQWELLGKVVYVFRRRGI